MKLLPQISLQINNLIQIHRFSIKNPFDKLPQAVRHPSNRNRVKAHLGAPSTSHIRRESWVHTQQRLCNSNPSEEPKRHQVSHNPHQLWVLRASWALWMSLHKRWRIAIFLSHCAWNGEVGYLCLNLLPFPVFQIPPTYAKREFTAVGVQETHHGVMVSWTFFVSCFVFWVEGSERNVAENFVMSETVT